VFSSRFHHRYRLLSRTERGYDYADGISRRAAGFSDGFRPNWWSRINSTPNRIDDRPAQSAGRRGLRLITLKWARRPPSGYRKAIALKSASTRAIWPAIGSGGALFIRHVPPILQICHDMEELCPRAAFELYQSNGDHHHVSVNDYTKIKSIGLCHSVTARRKHFEIHRQAVEEISYWVAGLNHFAWF